MVRKKTLANHQAVAHAATTLERIRLVRRGLKLTDHHKVFGAAYRPLDPQRPAPTVTRSGFRDFVHPDEDRCCTVRELARIQSFPDWYEFKGRRCDTYATSRYVKQTQHEQVGNAVPPLLSEKVARAIRVQIFDQHGRKKLMRARNTFASAFQVLDTYYPDDNLGNKRNPLDELIYIMLSRRAREAQYQKAFVELARRFKPWTKLLKASDAALLNVLQPLGLANQRLKDLREVLSTIAEDFGRLSLGPLQKMSYSDAYNYLRSLRGVNDKTAKCVMLYALDLPALPVDAHTLRVSKRLGLVGKSISLFKAPRVLEGVVPRTARGRYHVLAVLHGREICTPVRPRCTECPLRALCPTGIARCRRRATRARRTPA